MKALTIHQPYAELIARGDKLVENRTWQTRYRGSIAIHAGKSRDWLALGPSGEFDDVHDIHINDMPMGEIVAVWSLIDCVHIADLPRQHPSLAGHAHAHGPYCWVFDYNTAPVRAAVPARGKQGLWNWNEVPA